MMALLAKGGGKGIPTDEKPLNHEGQEAHEVKPMIFAGFVCFVLFVVNFNCRFKADGCFPPLCALGDLAVRWFQLSG